MSNDSTEAFNVLSKLQRQVKRGYPYNELLQAPGANLTYRSLDYLGLFQTVYPFENAMYETPTGEINPYTRGLVSI